MEILISMQLCLSGSGILAVVFQDIHYAQLS